MDPFGKIMRYVRHIWAKIPWQPGFRGTHRCDRHYRWRMVDVSWGCCLFRV